MKKIKNPLILCCIILGLCSLIATFFVLPQLPAQIPIHWNVAGEIDNYGSRNFALFTGVLPLLLLVLFVILPKIDPRKDSYRKHERAYTIFILLITVFMIMIHWATVLVALGHNISISMVVPISTGVLFIVIGNYMPQIRPNYTFGIRVPWALNNEDNWRATHRVGSYCFILAGLIMILEGLLSNVISSYIASGALLICIFAPMIYSYIYFKNQEGKNK